MPALFQVTTTRSKCNFKPAIVCLEDPLNRLEGLGTKTINRLQDVQLCIEDHGVEGTLPDIAVNKVETGEPYCHDIHCPLS